MNEPNGIAMISVAFHKPLSEWTDDKRLILAKLRRFLKDPVAFRRSAAERKRRKARKAAA